MIRKILIANRGEIACRIVDTCRLLGIQTVAVFSDADANARHAAHADEAVHIGGAAATDSYLNTEAILEAAARSGADAIHPGYGFLAENAAFAQAVIDAGLTWIGPTPDAIDAMGKKREAKRLLQDVPLLPGYQGDDQSDEMLLKAADEIGYPVMVKASAGGGGKGMRRVERAAAMPAALQAARREAAQAFGDDTLIIEKYIDNPRHIEIQIIGDTHGRVLALGERECSIQRRHQKIIEETPSPAVDAALRQAMSDVAVRIGQQLNYVNAGTVEFLMDDDGNFYFMEMNTRLQVEHPVTEEIYFTDLVRWQIHIAEGQHLPETFTASDHAIEARVYAEDPSRDFLPATGTVLYYREAVEINVRFDSGIQTGDVISTHYDPMLVKVIANAPERHEAIRLLDAALTRMCLLGLRHNIDFLRRTINHPDFIAGDLSTHFIDQHPELFEAATIPSAAVIAAALMQSDDAPWRNNRYRAVTHTFTQGETAFTVQLMPQRDGSYSVTLDDATYSIQVIERDAHHLTFSVDGYRQLATLAHHDAHWWIHFDGYTYDLHWQTPLPMPGRSADAAGSLRAPMPGQVVSVSVKSGQAVTQGQVVMTLEAMKMEHRIEAPHDGVVGDIYFSTGESVEADAILLDINTTDA